MSEENGSDSWAVDMAAEDLEFWDTGGADDPHALVDLVNRLLDKGVVISGDITISIAGVDLVYLGLNAVLTSVATARRKLGQPVGRAAVRARDQD
jgi:gas vesicle structural protein